MAGNGAQSEHRLAEDCQESHKAPQELPAEPCQSAQSSKGTYPLRAMFTTDHQTTADTEEPASFRKAMESGESLQWETAMKEELDSLERNNT